jgi:hypothetical protein
MDGKNVRRYDAEGAEQTRALEDKYGRTGSKDDEIRDETEKYLHLAAVEYGNLGV